MEIDTDNEQFMKPVDRSQRTDKFFMLIFPICILVWSAIAFFNISGDKAAPSAFWMFLRWISPTTLILEVIAVLIFFTLTVTFNLLKDAFLIFFVLFLMFAVMFIITTGILLLILFSFIVVNAVWPLLILFAMCISSCALRYTLTTIISVRKLGAESLAAMIKEPIRAIANFLPASIISLMVVVYFLLFVFIYTVTTVFTSIESLKYVNSGKGLICFGMFISVVTGMWLFNSLWNTGFMILGDNYAYYYSDGNVSRTSVFRGVAKVMRYHLGTIALLSTPVLPSVFALIMVFKNNKQSGQQSEGIFTTVINKISLAVNISQYALIQTSVHGSDALTSIRQMIDLHCKTPSLFLTLNAVSLKFVDLGMTTTIIVEAFIQYILSLIADLQNSVLPSKITFMAVLFIVLMAYVFTYFIYSIINLLMRPAMCTFTVYEMIRDQHEYKTFDEQLELTNG